MLLFKKKFLPAIRSGEKTQTIRFWKHRQMRAGQRSYIPGAGYVQVDAVDEVRLDQLTDADAVPDGFPTAEALRQELAAIYGEKLAAGYKTFRVRFHLTGETLAVALPTASPGLSPGVNPPANRPDRPPGRARG
ncbi:MAG TPA: ASCH domain-containing protein [Lacipirellulaceae bacterium]|nr:ASCH domain-containing protein [Lacipirellulaceae bacterium]